MRRLILNFLASNLRCHGPLVPNGNIGTAVTRSAFIKENYKGFTLVELMVGLVLASIVMVGIYRGFVGLVMSSETQEQLVEINQNLRVGLQSISDDLRMAGYDPTTKSTASFLNTSTAVVCEFTMDLDGDGVVEKTILYQVVGRVLQRVEDGTVRSLINNVDAIDFAYFDGAGTAVVPAVNPSLVRQVQVSLVVRSTNQDYSFTDADIYSNLGGTVILPAQNDNFHRRVESMEIRCRNMSS